ncbi:MAG: asparagine synthase (glutamine-hydrolyzing) [Desulfobacterales bacterium]|nr:MAG: asparagine synthase (glutamine-hydrolyzing) [Desulfobacterales bacterium]
MCGITGIFNLDGRPVSSVILREMTDTIAHRGPDSEGFYVDSFLGLGHRRLAVIDLSRAGHQPMTSPCEKYSIAFNGEVYNFKELRRVLEAYGHRFISRTDTEVVLHAYMEWGPSCVEKFNGMFAFALWDKTRQSLYLARDRYGIKPLYYSFQKNIFLFGSEQKAICAHDVVSKELDLEALVEYFTFQNIFTDKTLLKGIKLFPAASWALLPLGSGERSLIFQQYWDYDFVEPEPNDIRAEDEYVEELDFLFRQAVKRQLVSDVDVGAYLSGGIDSGSITAVAAQTLPYMKSFTCGFDLHSASGLELGFDEREKAEYMSYLFKTEHYEMVLKSGDMERVMPRLVWHLEEPRVGQSYPNFYAAQLASKFVKVVLSGAGGDELFGGYPWRYYRAVSCVDFDDYIDQYYRYWQRLIPNSTLKRLFHPIWDEVKHVWTRDIFKSVFQGRNQAPCSPEEYINHSLYFEAKTFLHGLLVVEDKLSSAHGLETRVPFLDNDLVDFAMRLPVKMKLRNLQNVVQLNENEPGPKQKKYFQKTNDGKNLLRKVMQHYIPDDIADAAKQGFSAPDGSWFKGESIEYVHSFLGKDDAMLFTFLKQSEVQALINEHLDGVENRRLCIWSLLSVENFLQQVFA